MTPVQQDRFGYPFGNCLFACYATLLNVPLHAIPDPRSGLRAGDARVRAGLANMQKALSLFAASRGYAAVRGSGSSPPVLLPPGAPPLYWIAHGPGPRGLNHAVIYANNRLAFDPYPGGTGLLRVTHWTVLAPLGTLR